MKNYREKELGNYEGRNRGERERGERDMSRRKMTTKERGGVREGVERKVMTGGERERE